MTFSYLNNEPIVPIVIKGRDRNWCEFRAYLDSGAGYSVFHPDHAEILGIDIYKGRKIYLTVGSGAKILSYVHKLPVRFAKEEFLAEISFSPRLGIETNVLGMKSFFDNFRICFNNKKKTVEAKPL